MRQGVELEAGRPFYLVSGTNGLWTEIWTEMYRGIVEEVMMMRL